MLAGIFPVIPTLFADDDTLDLLSQRKVIRFALDTDCHGVVFPGVASEYNHLSPVERDELIGLLVEEVNGKVPIIGGASAADTDGVIEAGQQARRHGIGHLMIMAPQRLGQDLEAHARFFNAVTKALPEAQIILQNAPAPIGAGLNAKTMASLARSNASITYIKEETLPSGPAITALLGESIPHVKGVFGGGGARYIIDELDRGASGAMPAVELTDLHVALYEAEKAGNRGCSRELYRLSLPLLVSQTVYRMRLTKYVLAKRGIADAKRVRAPLPELDEIAQRDIDQMLGELSKAFPCA